MKIRHHTGCIVVLALAAGWMIAVGNARADIIGPGDINASAFDNAFPFMIAVDLTQLQHGQEAAGVGAPVTLWGEGLSADEVGAAAGTLSYELFTRLTSRVPVVEVT